MLSTVYNQFCAVVLIFVVTATVGAEDNSLDPDSDIVQLKTCQSCDNKDHVCYWNDQLPAWKDEGGANYTTGKLITDSNGEPYTAWASKSVGAANTVMLSDHRLVSDILQLNRERIPERMAHAKGYCAKGYFHLKSSFLLNFTTSKVLTDVGKKYPITIRFSTTAGSLGSHEAEPDLRGMAFKMYTTEGNYDFMFLNSPCFGIWDPALFTSFVHSGKRNPQTHFYDPNMKWDFISNRHESMCMNFHVMTDIGCPKSWCNMPAHGVHTFMFVNSANQRFVTRMSLEPRNGIKGMTDEEIKNSEPDVLSKHLWDSISRGEPCKWDLYFQILPQKQADDVVGFNCFDITRIWHPDVVPRHKVGSITIDKHITNYYEECELIAFHPSHLPPGMALPCFDPVADARTYAYPDAQHYRLGSSYKNFPINQPIAPVLSYYRDSKPAGGISQDPSPNYYPNSFSNAKLGTTKPITCGTLTGAGTRIDTQKFMHTLDECIKLVETWNDVDMDRYALRFAREWLYVAKHIILKLFNLVSAISCNFLKHILDHIIALSAHEPRIDKSYCTDEFNKWCIVASR